MRKFRNSIKTLLYLTIFMCVACAALASAQSKVIVEHSFEEGTQNWEARGQNVSIGTTKKEFAGGKKSLRVRGRTAFWQGAQLNVTNIVSPGKTYELSVAVKLDKKQPPEQIKMTMQRGDNQFAGIAASEVSADGWTTLAGKYRDPGGADYLLLYIEAGRDRTAFFIDDFKIVETAAAPEQKGVLIRSDFEDKTAQGWFVRGSGVQMFSSLEGGGSRALRVDARSKPWHGLALDISPKLYRGRTYQLSVAVKLNKGASPDKLQLKILRTPTEGEAVSVAVSPAVEVTDGEWVNLQGDYAVAADDSRVLVYVEAERPETSFFIDDFELKVP